MQPVEHGPVLGIMFLVGLQYKKGKSSEKALERRSSEGLLTALLNKLNSVSYRKKILLSLSSHCFLHFAEFLLILSQADSISRTKKSVQLNVIQHTTSVCNAPLPQHSPALRQWVGTHCSASLCTEDNPLVSSLLYTLGQSGGSDCRGQSSSAFSEQILGG